MTISNDYRTAIDTAPAAIDYELSTQTLVSESMRKVHENRLRLDKEMPYFFERRNGTNFAESLQDLYGGYDLPYGTILKDKITGIRAKVKKYEGILGVEPLKKERIEFLPMTLLEMRIVYLPKSSNN